MGTSFKASFPASGPASFSPTRRPVYRGGHNGGPPGEPPVNTVAPVVSGSITVGSTLSCTTGTWTGDETITYAYQWRRDGNDISGATSSTYTLIGDDEGAMIDCVVTATNDAGSDDAASNAVGPVEEEPDYDADAAAYITATGALFPSALNTLVLKLKADGVWAKLAAVKFAIGVPSLADSMVDLRTPALLGTAVNTPGHDPEEGWSFTAASSQYIDSKFNPSTHASQDSGHVGYRVMDQSAGDAGLLSRSSVFFGVIAAGSNATINTINTGLISGAISAPTHTVASRTGATVQEKYKDGASINSNSASSSTPPNAVVLIGVRDNGGTLSQYLTGRITAFHAGTALDATDVANLTDAFDAYALACGEQ